jgi:2-amino-4-hydroxy-6-hydroxymethyldihydropteridine diphosphokinase
VLVVVGLGGNVGDAAGSFVSARAALAARHAVIATSSLWRSRAQGPRQTDYLNAAVLLDVSVHPLELLALTQRLEGEAGRDRRREERWGPRPLDLDLLLAGALVVEAPALTLPHPRLAERRFALLPAGELVPAWIHPRRHRTITDLAAAIPANQQPCERIGPFPADH